MSAEGFIAHALPAEQEGACSLLVIIVNKSLEL